jgi:hypothetical protein
MGILLPPVAPRCQWISPDSIGLEIGNKALIFRCFQTSLEVFGLEIGSANGDRTRTLSLERAAC